jgi:cyclopropane fatty-acyl-phospholipid synthase-like methyltransferase
VPVLADTTNTPEAWSQRAALPEPWAACGWSRHGQFQRFMAVLQHLPDLHAGDKLLDFGCGTAALHAWMPRGVRYYGVDWAEGMRERAKREHPEAVILPAPPGFQVDVTVCVGCFNLAGGWSREDTWATLERLWAQTTRVLLVSLYRGSDGHTMPYQPREAIAFADRVSCDRYRLDTSYLANDFLLELRR